MSTKVEMTGESQITIDRLAQITVKEGELVIDLGSPALSIEQDGARLTIRLNPRLMYTAPEEYVSVARDKGLKPYAYSRIEGEA